MKEYENNNSIDNKLEQRQKRDNTFNIIVGVSTLIIAILGGTFAYFSATASSNKNDVNLKSAYISIDYDGGTEIKASNLIPSSERVALKMFQKEAPKGEDGNYHTTEDGYAFYSQDEYTNDTDRRCVDIYGREVCYVYEFSITSEGPEGGTTEINGGVKIEDNQFPENDNQHHTNLSYIVYEVNYDENTLLYDKYRHRVIESYTPKSTFNLIDDETYADLQPKYAAFEKQYDINSSGYIATVHPISCLFGYLTEEEISEKYSNQTINSDDIRRCSPIYITNQKTHTYQMMVFLRETGENQPEQGLSFQGTVNLEVPGAGGSPGQYIDGQITGKDTTTTG